MRVCGGVATRKHLLRLEDGSRVAKVRVVTPIGILALFGARNPRPDAPLRAPVRNDSRHVAKWSFRIDAILSGGQPNFSVNQTPLEANRRAVSSH